LIAPRLVSRIPFEDRELKDKNTAHPHYHCLIAVPPSYMKGQKYLSTAKWARLWQECLQVDYTPICDARVVKPKDYSALRGKTVWDTPEREKFELSVDETRNAVRDAAYDVLLTPDGDESCIPVSGFEYIFLAIKEVIKYAVKPDDMLLDPDWLIELSTQLKNTRSIALGGELKKYLKDGDEDSNQELIGETENENDGGVFFGWRERLERYQRTK
jgi:hypothetical protein